MGFRDSLPASLQMVLQDGLLDGVFQDALVPANLYDTLCDIEPWAGRLGDTSIKTRGGLMAPSATPVTGNDASTGSYGFEQYTVTMDQYGLSKDTNMADDALATASLFLEDNAKLGINAAESLNLLARTRLYNAYGEGFSYVDESADSGASSIHVASANGYAYATKNMSTSGGNSGEGTSGTATPQLVPVSGSAQLSVTIGGTANTVTGVEFDSGSSGPGTLTLGTNLGANVSVGAAVIASNAPASFRPNGRATAYDLVSGDIATLSLFQSAVTRLRTMNVPRIRGAYTAHVTPQTVEELFQDEAFQRAYIGRGDSPAYRDFHPGDNMGDAGEFMGRFIGIDWVMNNATPGTGSYIGDSTLSNPDDVQYWRPVVVGAGAIVKAPFSGMANLVTQQNAGATVEVQMIGGVARILRAPLDRFGQVLSSTWSWIGDYACGTDLLTGDNAAYKRAVVLEHA